MLDGDNSTRQLVSWVVQALAIVIIGLVVAAVVTTFTDQLASARLLATIAGALATVVLAALVGWYASSMEAVAAENQRLQRRPYVKRIVATGIDRVLAWLDRNRAQWAREDPPLGMPIYPEVDDVDVAEDVVADIARTHPDLVDDVSEFLSASRAYRREWDHLARDLERHVATEFTLSDPPATLEAVVPDRYADRECADDVDPQVDPEAFVADHAALFARFVLTNPQRSPERERVLDAEDYAYLLFDASRSEFLNVRGADAVADRVETVHRHLEDVAAEAEDVRERLQDARAEFVEEYDLMETELGAVREGGRTPV
ncbi:MAG: hypothetical protein ABEJ31_14535 [Haloarculaceae archaeon]